MLTFPDKVLIGVLLFLSVFSFAAIRVLKTEGTMVVMKQGNKVVGRYPLKEERNVVVEGPLEGTARIVDSPCPQKICVRMGKIRRVGDIVVCVQNQVLVRVEGKVDEEVPDAISR